MLYNMSSRCHRRHSLALVVATGAGKVMLWSAAVPLIVVWYTIKVLAILALALYDLAVGTARGSRPARTTELDDPAGRVHRARMVVLLGYDPYTR